MRLLGWGVPGIQERLQGVELCFPKPAELGDPGIDRGQAFPVERIHSMTILFSHPHETRFPKNSEVPRQPWLADGGEGTPQLPRGTFVSRKQVEDLTSRRIG